MKRFVEQRQDFVRKTRWPQFSAKVVGQQYKKRLEQIRTENPELFLD